MSLAPMATALGEVLGRKVRFAEDCIGLPAQQAVERDGATATCWCWRTRASIAGEEKNDPAFAAELAKLADLSSTTRSPPRIARMPAPRAWRICCPPMPGG